MSLHFDFKKRVKETNNFFPFLQTPTSSPMVNGHSSPSESGVGTSLSSTTPSPRPGDDNSTARLLRHLQGRVQQLRAQNDSLRKSSENESLNESHCSVVSTESVRTAESLRGRVVRISVETIKTKNILALQPNNQCYCQNSSLPFVLRVAPI